MGGDGAAATDLTPERGQAGHDEGKKRESQALHVFQSSNMVGRTQVAVGVSTQLLPVPHSHSSARCRSQAIDRTSVRCAAESSR